MGAVAGLLHRGTVADGLLPAAPLELEVPVNAEEVAGGAGRSRAATAPAAGGDRPGDRVTALGAGAGGRWAGGVPVLVCADGGVLGPPGAGGAGRGGGRHAAGGGVRAARAGLAADRGVLRPA